MFREIAAVANQTRFDNLVDLLECTPDILLRSHKALPHVPMSHPFVERLIGSIRRELLDQTLFWTATDLENKLREYQCYSNEYRNHSGGLLVPR